MKNTFTLLFCLTIIIVSCKEQNDKKDFLDFYIGMTEKSVDAVRDSLLEAGTIYKHKKDYYYDFKIDGVSEIPSRISWDIKNKKLNKIFITLGRKSFGELPRNNATGITNDFFTECIDSINANLVYNNYKNKYGKPDELNSNGNYPCWKKFNHINVKFSKGYKNDYSCDSSRYIMGAFITYSFDSEYEIKSEKNNQDNF